MLRSSTKLASLRRSSQGVFKSQRRLIGESSKDTSSVLLQPKGKPPVIREAVPVSPGPQQPPKIKKKFLFPGFLFKTFLATSVLYGGVLYAATKNETVMDFVIEHDLPLYEGLLDVIEHGSFDELKKRMDSVRSKIILPSKEEITKLTAELEERSEEFLHETRKLAEKTQQKFHHTTPAEQLQKNPEFESVVKEYQHIPLIKVNDKLDDSLKSTIESFNNLLRTINVPKGPLNDSLLKSINESVAQLTVRLDDLTNNFNEAVEKQVKETQTEYLRSSTAKELELTETLLGQFKNERLQLEKKLNERMTKEVEATREAISQAAANAVAMVRIEDAKKFESMVKDKIDTERNGRLANLDKINTRLEELEQYALSIEEQLSSNNQKVLIHQSIVKLKTVLKTDTDPSEKPKLVKPYLDDLAKVAAGADDQVIDLTLKELYPLLSKESNQTILTTPQLLTRWQQLSGELRSASLLPPNAGLLGHLASVLFSKLLVPVSGNKPDGKDIESVIARVEDSLARDHLDEAVEDVANLKGWTRKLADDWVVEARKRLEIEFLVDVIDAESRIL
ncbi:Formation of crista junctions protein 1 [Scheffersomyces spartinae]|uniref:MICOS complex subunit MIC60 n=1 Tax=Scheffersomyces spartinae TaxID=45513 RepID=A0A9P8AFX7_9ASCO|nr:Formation of crista junctions protein 1 [Scheffersomyces spartinae]KAG7191393.1 Formation of crista junctions protein 1 [Scheffersomyces spartinae]